MSVTVFTEYEQLSDMNNKQGMMLRIKAPDLKHKPESRSVCIVLGVSSSTMFVIPAMRELLNYLTDNDKVCVIQCTGELMFDWRECTLNYKNQILDRLALRGYGGSNNISGSLCKAVEKLSETAQDGLIFMISNGRPTAGISRYQEINELMASVCAYPIHTIGVGNYKENLLQGVSDMTDGKHTNYTDEIHTFYTEILGATYTLAYQNMRLELCSTEIHFHNKDGEPVVDIELGDIYANEVKDVKVHALFVKRKSEYTINYVLTGMDIMENKTFGLMDKIHVVRGDDQTRSTIFDTEYIPTPSPFF